MSLSDGRYAVMAVRSTLGEPRFARYIWPFPLERDGEAMIRDDIKAALVSAMKGGDKETVATLRMVSSAIKNRDIELRTSSATPEDDALVTDVLAANEEAEIATIERFLPAQMDEAGASAAIQAIIAELGASSMKDMGRVMAEVKARLATQIEPARASAMVKAALAG
jgi:uncharacterized protein YqeY